MAALLITALLLAPAAAQVALTVRPDGSYAVSQNGVSKLKSAQSAYVVRSGGKVLSSGDGSLRMDAAPQATSGSDIVGSWSGYTVAFNAGLFVATFKLYAARDTIIFEQSFPKGCSGMASPSGENDLVTGFPVFGEAKTQLNDNNTAYLAWSGGMSPGHTGLWVADRVDYAGLNSQGGPLALFDRSLATLVLSPASGFMTAQLAFGSSTGEALGAGHNGMVDTVPAGWTLETVLVGGQGIGVTMDLWGDVLLARGGKERTKPDADLIISTLGWWSDKCV